MPIDLGNLALDQATTTAVFGGQEAKVSYKPSMLTTKALRNIQQRIEADDPDAFISFLSEILLDWDVTQDGERFPWDTESLLGLPLSFIRAVYLAILSDAGQGEAEGRSSAG